MNMNHSIVFKIIFKLDYLLSAYLYYISTNFNTLYSKIMPDMDGMNYDK